MRKSKDFYQYVTSKTPFRISLGGGGTDLPNYSKIRGGELLTAAINQYCTVSLSSRPLDNNVLVQTTKVEFRKSTKDIKHEIIRETLRYFKLDNALQLSTFTSIPTRTGLGSSSTLIVGLICAITKMKNIKISKREIAKLAYKIERKILNLKGGIQDQYISAFGGIQKIKVSKTGIVNLKTINISPKVQKILNSGLVMIYSGKQRNSSRIIKSIKDDQSKVIEVFDEIKELGKKSYNYLINGDIEMIGKIMNKHWELKKKLSSNMSSFELDKSYKELKKYGSPGGKIVGAGGGGFFMMAVNENKKRYLKKLNENGYRILDWKFDFNGTHIIDKG